MSEKVPVLLIPGCAGSILFGRDLKTNKVMCVYPKIIRGDEVSKKYLWCDMKEDFTIQQRFPDTEVFAPMDNHGLYACYNVVSTFPPMKRFEIFC